MCVHVGFFQLPESHGWIINSMSNLSSSFIPLLGGNKLSLHFMVKTTHLYMYSVLREWGERIPLQEEYHRKFPAAAEEEKVPAAAPANFLRE